MRKFILLVIVFFSLFGWSRERNDEELQKQAEQFKQGMLSLYKEVNSNVEKIYDNTAKLYYFDISVYEQTQLATSKKELTKKQSQKRLKLIESIQNEESFKNLLYGMVVLEGVLQEDLSTMKLLNKHKPVKQIYDEMDLKLKGNILNAFAEVGNVYAYGDDVLYEHHLPKDPRFRKVQVLSEDFLDFRISYFKEKNIAYKYDEEYPKDLTVKNPAELDKIRRDIFDKIGDVIEEEFAHVVAEESRNISVSSSDLQTKLNLQTMMSWLGRYIEISQPFKKNTKKKFINDRNTKKDYEVSEWENKYGHQKLLKEIKMLASVLYKDIYWEMGGKNEGKSN